MVEFIGNGAGFEVSMFSSWATAVNVHFQGDCRIVYSVVHRERHRYSHFLSQIWQL